MVKYDVSVEPELPPQDLKVGGNINGLFLHGDGRYGSEVFFVPRNAVGKDIQEDDGYLLCFVHDEKIGYGYFNIVFPTLHISFVMCLLDWCPTLSLVLQNQTHL